MIVNYLSNAYFKEEYKKAYEKHRIPENMTNAEIKTKICRDVPGGCKKCEVLDRCLYGQQYILRKLQ